MNFKGQYTILTSNLKQKWLRSLIASGGIMIGVACIAVTTSLSFGVLDTFTKAINSQYTARELTIGQTKDGNTDSSLFDNVAFKALPFSWTENTKRNYPTLDYIYPTQFNLSFDIGFNNDINCYNKSKEIDKLPLGNPVEQATVQVQRAELLTKCQNINTTYQPYEVFYNKNKKFWVGSKSEPKTNEIVIEYNRTNKDILAKQGINKAEDLLNKEYQINLLRVEGFQDITDTKSNATQSASYEKEATKKIKIVAVIDSTKNEGGFLLSFEQNKSYVDLSIYQEALKEAKNPVKYENVGFSIFTGVVNSFDKVESTVKTLKENKIFSLSAVLDLLKGVSWVIYVTAGFLSLFGLIALLVSVFGIINVIAMSVLERNKEIGILKSLGTSNASIFGLFIGEGIFIGILGWLLGSILSTTILFTLNYLANSVLLPNFENARNALASLNITELNLTQPLWIYGVTILIAVFFTVISSIIPSISAARKRPVDILRAE
jgi:ABC-type lipoprotein release transport system permease subunit